MISIGIVFVRQVGAPQFEAFFNQIIAGLEDVLSASSNSLVVQRVEDEREERAVYRHWHASGVVDAVIIKDLMVDDDRIEWLNGIGLPFVVLCDVTQTGPFSAVRIDNGQVMRDSMAFLRALGHDDVARVTGPAALAHTRIRTNVFLAEADAAGITTSVVVGDYSETAGERATLALLGSSPRPTAVVYDNDLMALGGLAAAKALGVRIPEDLSMLAWDDSVQCQLATPPLSTLSHDVQRIGVQLGTALLRMLADEIVVSETASQPMIVERGTTGPKPRTPADASSTPQIHDLTLS